VTTSTDAVAAGDNLSGRTATPTCAHWIGPEQRHCKTTDGVRLYITGWCCPLHTPSALAGKPEPPAGPGWPASAWTTPTPQGVAAVIDERAIASGRRRSSHSAYRAAQAAEKSRKAAAR
jgi:hypothetical protein